MTASEDSDEAARLRQEVERLRRQLNEDSPDRGGRTGWWRPLVAGILVGVATLLAPISVLATWARDEIEDTDRYVETITPLASNPAVQDAVASRIEEVIFDNLDIDAAVQDVTDALEAQNLPSRVVSTLEAVSGPLASAIRGFISDRIQELVESDLFEQAWIEANRLAHAQLVAVLTGEGTDAVDVADGAVSLDIAPLIGEVKNQLVDSGFGIASRIPDVDATFTIFHSDELTDAQSLFKLLDGVATWLPVVALLMVAAAVMVARDRRRTILVAGLALVAAMLLLGAALNLARPIYLDAIPTDAIPTDAAAAVYDTLVGFIRLALRAVLVVALAVALIAWLSAPTGSGATARHGLSRGIAVLRSGRARAGLQTGAFGAALARYRSAIRIGVIGCAALIYLLRDHPTGSYALTVIITAAVVLVVVEVLAAPPAAPTDPAPSEPTDPAPVEPTDPAPVEERSETSSKATDETPQR
jgi:hypothetical protein